MPITKLISKEMSKKSDSKGKYFSVVAQLMGIDDINLDQQHAPISTKRMLQSDYPSTTLAAALKGCHQKEDTNFNKFVPCELQQYVHDNTEFRDEQQVLKKPSRASIIKDQWGNCNDNQNEKNRKVFLQKHLMERKHVEEEVRLFHSKEFQDALKVLSSNRELFLKILQDPDSIIPKDIRNVDVSTQLRRRRIAVLKPTKKFDKTDENLVTEENYPVICKNECGTIKEAFNKVHSCSDFTRSKAENTGQPTRIVVLKPSTTKSHDMKAKVTSPVTLCKLLEQGGFFGEFADSEGLGSRLNEEEFTWNGQECITYHHTDESFDSLANAKRSVDEDSFYISESENIEEVGHCCRDSEILNQTSLCSCEHTNGTCSSSSALTFSHSSNSPKSSVVVVARKQLLERWASVTSDDNDQEQTETQRFSFSLAEMLSVRLEKEGVSDDKFTVMSNRSYDPDVELELSSSCKTFSNLENMARERSPGSLSRSKSLPISPTSYERIGLGETPSNFSFGRKTEPKAIAKSKNDKASLKEKISSFFFPKTKKASREKLVSPFVGCDVKAQSDSVAGLAVNKDAESVNPLCSNFPTGFLQVNYGEETDNGTSATPVAAATSKAFPLMEKPKTCNTLRDDIKFRSYDNSKRNQNLPSPTLVLDAPFVGNANDNASLSKSVANAGPHAISRATPIESVARSISWEYTNWDMPSPGLSVLNKKSSKVDNNEEEHLASIRKQQSLEKSSMISARCHSLQSQLGSVLLNKFADWNSEEAKVKRSKQNLLFGHKNSDYSIIEDAGSSTLQSAYTFMREFGRALSHFPANSTVSIEVWNLVRDSNLTKTMWVMDESCNGSMMVGRAVMLWGCRLSDSLSEVEEICKEISGDVLQDLLWGVLAEISS